MLLRYISPDGHLVELELGSEMVTIGRAPDASIVLQGEKVSRTHCAIRLWEHDYVIKDYGSTNGTYLNENRIQVAVIKPGDVIRIGTFRIQADLKSTRGTKTILKELSEEMEEGGKGYRTMLREIVQSTTPVPDATSEPAKPAESDPAEKKEPGDQAPGKTGG